MAPRRYLGASLVGKRLGLSRNAVIKRLGRGHGSIPEPDIIIEDDRGDVYGWDPDRKDLVWAVMAGDPAVRGGDPASWPDDMLIGMRTWAALQGTSPAVVAGNRYRAALRRAEGSAEPWDMPPEDTTQARSPRWRMSTYRAWEAAQEALKAAHPGVWRNSARGRRQP